MGQRSSLDTWDREAPSIRGTEKLPRCVEQKGPSICGTEGSLDMWDRRVPRYVGQTEQVQLTNYFILAFEIMQNTDDRQMMKLFQMNNHKFVL